MNLHRCPPLRAFITVAQCDHNRRVAERSIKSSPGTDAWGAGLYVRECCSSCPGVVALDAGTRDMPELKPRTLLPPTPRRRSLVPVMRIPPEYITREQLGAMFKLTPHYIGEKLRALGIKPAVPTVGNRPSLYWREQTVEALGGNDLHLG